MIRKAYHEYGIVNVTDVEDEVRLEIRKMRDCAFALASRLELTKANGEKKVKMLLKVIKDESRRQTLMEESIMNSESSFEERRRDMKETIVALQDRTQVALLTNLRVLNNRRTLLDLKIQELSGLAQKLSKISKENIQIRQEVKESEEPVSFIHGIMSSLPEPLRSAVVEYLYKRASIDEGEPSSELLQDRN
ncbi:Laminin subunit beta-1 [Trichuris trichiura]|uniref:Laminin subunit beta-1 n=1 Tax=Trichuris trichiura TaxID=36087 RepID=A0A077Z0M2_TRITR|nr:Laminin subunit beta-1 [Trichuris trichiura]